ncbi:hypothetical protein NDU88_001532 [Pleurodeles waltl]|uniref:Uncharacterized protein n=1 Tax=Pleurodeles waltl TaxID=8319 RepID=A0AAV7W0I5_PLEWA|nr:hypothetical protein NDU88_001532 [Pleurodeles waltl]
MAAEDKVQEALRLLREEGRLGILKEGVGGPSRPPRRASGSVEAAVIACSSPRAAYGRQAVRRRGGGRCRGRVGGAAVEGRGRPGPPAGLKLRGAEDYGGPHVPGPPRRGG